MTATSAGAALRLPRAGGVLEPYSPGEPGAFAVSGTPATSRVAFAAAHVVADPLGEPGSLDWEATLAFRRHLWAHGLGVAEAMDTAQRGMGLDWPAARELIRRSAAEAPPGRLAAGAGTDHAQPRRVADVRAAYEHQCELVEDAGAQAIVMASRALATVARGPDDYREVYGVVLGGLRRPAILHWLGDMFDPALSGYWGSRRPRRGHRRVPRHRHRARRQGRRREGVAARRRPRDRAPPAPAGGRPALHRRRLQLPGADRRRRDGHSDALLGVFDAIAPAAAAALAALDDGDREAYERIFEPTVPLARKLFEAPTFNYKTGIVFLAFLNGHQEHFRMVGGLESARSIVHLADVFVLADRAGLLRDPALAVARMRHVLALAGIA